MRESITQIRRVIVSRRSRSGTATTEKNAWKEDKQKGAGKPAPVHKDFDELLFLIFPNNGDNIFLFDIDKIKCLAFFVDDLNAKRMTARKDVYDRSFAII